jgi:hypothetical protein
MTLESALTAALEDEYRARATYRAVLDAFGDVRPFVNVVESEERHIEALQRLCERYRIEIPVDRWPGRCQAPESVEAACEKAVNAERENAALYEKLLRAAQGYPDVEAVFQRLRTASRENHLPAFERGLRREQRRSDDVGSNRRCRRRRGGRSPRVD